MLDSILAVIVLLLLAPRFTALPLHEWLGLALIPPFFLHLLLSWEWIAGVFRKLLAGAPRRSYVNFALNSALFVLAVNEVVSGIMISQVAMPAFGVRAIDDSVWRTLHNQFLGWLRLVIGLHVAMNWRWIVSAMAAWTRRSATWLEQAGSGATLAAGVGRTLALLAAVAVVAGTVLRLAGPRSLARNYGQNEIAHFAGGHWMGVFQVVSQIGLLALVAYAGHRWLRVRL